MGLPLLRPMIMRAGRGRKATVRRKTRRRRSKKTEEGDKHLLWGRRRNSLTDNFTLAVYMRFLVAADSDETRQRAGSGPWASRAAEANVWMYDMDCGSIVAR